MPVLLAYGEQGKPSLLFVMALSYTQQRTLSLLIVGINLCDKQGKAKH